MKAKEYVEKYGASIMGEVGTGSTNEVECLASELLSERSLLCEMRHSSSDPTVVAVEKELNQKWAAIILLYEKKHGAFPVERQWFAQYCRVHPLR
jgi:hypothetical protein